MAKLTPEQAEFVRQVTALCEKHYEDGGDTVVECFSPEDILKEFKTLEDVREYCGLKVEQATNYREGTDDDPELGRMRRFEENWNE